MPAKKLPPPASTGLPAKNGDAILLVGTMKGLFLLRARPDRRRWDEVGPFFPGSTVYGAAMDTRAGRRRIWAAPSSMHWGAELAWTDDFGKTWSRPATPLVRFPESAGASLKNIWQITPGRGDEPDAIYCGVEPSALFESKDAGQDLAAERGPLEPPPPRKVESGRRRTLPPHRPGRPRRSRSG